MVFNPKFIITQKINKSLVEIERVRGFLDAIKLKDEWFADMQKEILILETHYSTHIEGTELSLEQAKSILEGKDIRGIRPDDKKELLNYKNIRQEKIIRYLVINDNIDNEQCQKLCGSIKRTATRDLISLVEKGLLEKKGKKKGTYYIFSYNVGRKIRDINGHN